MAGWAAPIRSLALPDPGSPVDSLRNPYYGFEASQSVKLKGEPSMPCNHPCKTSEIRAPSSKVQVQSRAVRGGVQVGDWGNTAPAASESVNNTPLPEHIRSRQVVAQDEAAQGPQAAAGTTACADNCPCSGQESDPVPMSPHWTGFETHVGANTAWQWRFQVERELVFIEGWCLEPEEEPDDWEEVPFGMGGDQEFPGGEVAVAIGQISQTVARIEELLIRADERESSKF